jgi:REP element-mobilizing transposase RayT
MGRPTRQWIEGSLYHVFSRGSNRQAIFLNEGDYVEFDMLLSAAVRTHRVDVFGCSLKPNHWHGIFRCPPSGLSEFMQRLNHRYALRFDRRWGRTAHVFDNRFGAVLQETEEQFLTTLRYVVRNPVTAGICSSPFDARWTSFPATIGIVSAPEYLRTREILDHFGDDPVRARERFIAFVAGDTPAVEGPSSEPPPAWGTIAA